MDELPFLIQTFRHTRPPPSSTTGNNDKPNPLNCDNDASSTTSSQRGRLFQSLDACVVFKNKRKKKGVKFDPNFHFIIGQLIVKMGKSGTYAGVTN